MIAQVKPASKANGKPVKVSFFITRAEHTQIHSFAVSNGTTLKAIAEFGFRAGYRQIRNDPKLLKKLEPDRRRFTTED